MQQIEDVVMQPAIGGQSAPTEGGRAALQVAETTAGFVDDDGHPSTLCEALAARSRVALMYADERPASNKALSPHAAPR